MAAQSIALKVLVVAAILIVAATLFVYAMGTRGGNGTTTTPPPVSSTTYTSTIIGEISFTSPAADTTYRPGQTLTISGSITPKPESTDTVFLQASQSDSTTAISDVLLTVGPDGTFSYSTVVSPYWYPGAYVITVSDSNGATAYQTFLVSDSPQ